MQGLPTAQRRILTIAATCAAAALACAAQASGLDLLRDRDPVLETAGPADAGFAAACRASASERLGGERFAFDRPAHSVRDGRQIVRMDLLAPGQRRDPDRIFRAVCVRETAGQPVDAMIFDAPVNGIGPRVVVIPGPTPDMRPRPPGPEPIEVPAGVVVLPGYESYGLPGLAVPAINSWPRRDGAFPDKRFDRQSRAVLETQRGTSGKFVAPRAKSNTTRFGSQATTRMGTGAFIR